MKKTLVSLLHCLLLFGYAQFANAGLIQYFKDEDGNTKWQYVANFSSGVLIILLSILVIVLFFSHRRTIKANRELEDIKDALEERVKERTAYIKDILESMPLMLIGLDKQNQVTQWNRLAEDITKVTAADAIGKNLWDAYPTITVSPDQIKTVVEENKPITIKHSQRGQYYFDITIYPLREQLETSLVILIDNVTQRILAENMLIQRDKMSSMGELAATMAHDIDIPLQAILRDVVSIENGLSDYLKDNNSNITDRNGKPIGELLNDVADKGQQASAVISNLLDFSRTEGDLKRPAQIPEIIEHAIELACDLLSDPGGLRFRDIKIERNYENNLPDVPSYVSELQQVFLNLFRHACHSLANVTREDFVPTLKLEVLEIYDALWIKVQHNGQGLNSEEQQYLFEPFFNQPPEGQRVDPANRLSFSYFIITEHHEGQMAVTSDVDVGTTFHIQLQLK